MRIDDDNKNYKSTTETQKLTHQLRKSVEVMRTNKLLTRTID